MTGLLQSGGRTARADALADGEALDQIVIELGQAGRRAVADLAVFDQLDGADAVRDNALDRVDGLEQDVLQLARGRQALKDFDEGRLAGADDGDAMLHDALLAVDTPEGERCEMPRVQR